MWVCLPCIVCSRRVGQLTEKKNSGRRLNQQRQSTLDTQAFVPSIIPMRPPGLSVAGRQAHVSRLPMRHPPNAAHMTLDGFHKGTPRLDSRGRAARLGGMLSPRDPKVRVVMDAANEDGTNDAQTERKRDVFLRALGKAREYPGDTWRAIEDLTGNQWRAVAGLTGDQMLAFGNITGSQVNALANLTENQVMALGSLTENQVKALDEMTDDQVRAFGNMTGNQVKALAKLTGNQAKALGNMTGDQVKALGDVLDVWYVVQEANGIRSEALSDPEDIFRKAVNAIRSQALSGDVFMKAWGKVRNYPANGLKALRGLTGDQVKALWDLTGEQVKAFGNMTENQINALGALSENQVKALGNLKDIQVKALENMTDDQVEAFANMTANQVKAVANMTRSQAEALGDMTGDQVNALGKVFNVWREEQTGEKALTADEAQVLPEALTEADNEGLQRRRKRDIFLKAFRQVLAGLTGSWNALKTITLDRRSDTTNATHQERLPDQEASDHPVQKE